MHERYESEPEEPLSDFTPALAYLLGEGDDQLGEFGGLYAAELLYRVSCDPSPERIEELLKEIDGVENNDLIDTVYEVIQSGEKSQANYLESLSSVIEDLRAPSLKRNADAVHLAYNIHAWELADAIRSVQMIIAQLHNDALAEEWLDLMREIDNFFAYMNTEENAQIESAGQDDSLRVFRDFINSLDMDDFTGRKG